MKKLKSENIVEFIDVVETANHYYVIQEYCNGGDLRKRIETNKRFSEKEVISYLKDILSGFITLISNGVIHRYSQAYAEMSNLRTSSSITTR